MFLIKNRLIVLVVFLLVGCTQHSKDPIEQTELKVDPEIALEYLNDLEEDKKKDPDFYFQRAKVYYDLARFEDAYTDVVKAVNLDKSFERAYFLKGQLEKQQGQPRKAIESLLIAEKLGSRDEELYRTLASEYLQLGEVSLAKAAVDRLVKLRKDAGSLLLQGDILLSIGDSAQAIASYNQTISLAPKQPEPYEKLVAIYNNRSDAEKAGNLLNSYFSFVTFDKQMLLEKGRLLNRLNLYDSAIDVYHKILATDSTGFMTYYELSNSFFAKKRFDSSLYYASKVVEQDSQFTKAKLTLARSLNAQRDYNEAIAVYQSILRQDSTNNLAAVELAELQRKVAYLWQLEQRRKQRDSVANNLPPTLEKKDIDN